MNKLIKFLIPITLMIIWLVSCDYDYEIVEPEPLPPQSTANLIANYTQGGASDISHPYWSKADYKEVQLEDVVTGLLYPDGYLKMTNTFNGLRDFNNGNKVDLILKAAYDDEYIYILAEWKDNDLDIRKRTFIWDGENDPLKPDSAKGWTIQYNDDKIAFAFDLEKAASSGKFFSDEGCDAACHEKPDGSFKMYVESGKLDVWNWSLVGSAPLGYALNLLIDPEGFSVADGQNLTERNYKGTTPREGPAWTWDGTDQFTTDAWGNEILLDPAYFILNKTEFEGSPIEGKSLFISICNDCHGEDGWAPKLSNPGMNRMSKEAIVNYSNSDNHTGQVYFNQLSETEITDVISYIRGLTGVPGNVFVPKEQSESDIKTMSNISFGRINNNDNTLYKVLFKRKLITGNPNDIQFDLSKELEYIFGIALMDGDGLNHIGSLKETLIFIEK